MLLPAIAVLLATHAVHAIVFPRHDCQNSTVTTTIYATHFRTTVTPPTTSADKIPAYIVITEYSTVYATRSTSQPPSATTTIQTTTPALQPDTPSSLLRASPPANPTTGPDILTLSFAPSSSYPFLQYGPGLVSSPAQAPGSRTRATTAPQHAVSHGSSPAPSFTYGTNDWVKSFLLDYMTRAGAAATARASQAATAVVIVPVTPTEAAMGREREREGAGCPYPGQRC
ncbi:hypothetical protein ACN47E_005033 [Coniothyrium glycines]